MVKITVYIPTHNYGRYLDRSIRSVIQQTMDDWELIVIDDGSTDNSREILEKYKDDNKIRIIEQENKGLNVTNNIALRLSNGQYIIRLDADDYFDENILLVLSNVLDKRRDVDLVYPDYYHISENGDILETVRRQKIGEEVELLDLPAHGACTMIRKSCLIGLDGYDEEFRCQDGYGLWLKFLLKHKPYNVNIPLFYYRQHQESLTKNQQKILDARRKIKSKFVDGQNGGKRTKTLGVIPVVKRSAYYQGEPFVEIAGKPLIWYSLNEAVKARNLDRIVVTTDDSDVVNYAKQFDNVTTLMRPKELTRTTARIENTIDDVLSKMEEGHDYVPEAVCILYITTPLRMAHHIDLAVDTMTIFQVDSIISIEEELSYCYFHDKYGLRSVSKTERGVRSERNAIYKENGAIYLSKADLFRRGELLGKSVGHITMLPEESLKITSEYELWLAHKIIQEWRERTGEETVETRDEQFDVSLEKPGLHK